MLQVKNIGLFIGLCLTLGCTVITNSDRPATGLGAPCVLGGPGTEDPCPANLTCDNGMCVAEVIIVTEACDGIDNDGDGITDEGVTPLDNIFESCVTLGADDDCDGKIDEANGGVEICGDGIDNDCFNGVDVVTPGAVEVCDGGDNDCDGIVDEDVPADTVEICNGLDEDCDGKIDEGPENDPDGDNYTWCGTFTQCTPVQGGQNCAPRADTVDCDHNDASRFPSNPEVCDGIDNDCVGGIDDNATCSGNNVCFEGACLAPNNCTLPGQECPATEICENGQCFTTTCTAGSCPAGQYCSANGCVDQKTNVELCTEDKECSSGLCQGICFQACCGKRDCPNDQDCLSDASGLRFCGPQMEGLSGIDCSRESDCAGLACNRQACTTVEPIQCLVDDPDLECSPNSTCALGGSCLTACGTKRDCPSAQDCGLVLAVWEGSTTQGFFPQFTTACRNFCEQQATDGTCSRFAETGHRQPCEASNECTSGLCLDDQCQPTCCTNSDCNSNEKCAPFGRRFRIAGELQDVYTNYCIVQP